MRTGILGFVRLDTSFGEASSRTQATDPNRRETLRIRTPLPGLRGEAKWLAVEIPVKRRRSQYAVECQSSYERGASQGFPSSWRVFPQVSRGECDLAPPCVATGREACDGL